MFAGVSSPPTDGLYLLGAILAHHSLHTSDTKRSGKEHFKRAAYKNLKSCYNILNPRNWFVCVLTVEFMRRIYRFRTFTSPAYVIPLRGLRLILLGMSTIHLVYIGAMTGKILQYILYPTALHSNGHTDKP